MPLNAGTLLYLRAALMLGLGLAAPLAFAAAAHAVTRFQRSVYTAFSLADCEALKSPADGTAYLCPGLPGFPVYVAEIDGRTFVSTSAEPQTAKAASQSLGAFNTPFARTSKRATIEWRFTIRDGRKVPYATIVRYYTALNRTHGQVLVVTRVAGSAACQAAHVDAMANDQPIVLARRFADDEARAFECSSPPRVLGETGKSPM